MHFVSMATSGLDGKWYFGAWCKQVVFWGMVLSIRIARAVMHSVSMSTSGLQ